MDNDGGSGSSIGQWWMMTMMKMMTQLRWQLTTMVVPPPSLLPSLLADALASLYFPALSVAFGLPLLTSSRSNTVMTVDAPSFSNRLPRGGHIQHHCRDGSNRDDGGVDRNGGSDRGDNNDDEDGGSGNVGSSNNDNDKEEDNGSDSGAGGEGGNYNDDYGGSEDTDNNQLKAAAEETPRHAKIN